MLGAMTLKSRYSSDERGVELYQKLLQKEMFEDQLLDFNDTYECPDALRAYKIEIKVISSHLQPQEADLTPSRNETHCP